MTRDLELERDLDLLFTEGPSRAPDDVFTRFTARLEHEPATTPCPAARQSAQVELQTHVGGCNRDRAGRRVRSGGLSGAFGGRRLIADFHAVASAVGVPT